MGLGIIQSFAILRILTVSEWGLVQLVVSIGASLGIYQHLGLASASNREIAASDKKTDVFKIFATSVSVRYLVTIPLSIGLFIFAPKIAVTYDFPQILVPLRIYSGIIFLQGIQAILNAVISGTKRFKELFIFQGVIALASLIIYVPFVYYFKIMGFFYAFLIHEGIKSISLLVIAFKPYIGKLRFPTAAEFKTIFKQLFSLGLSIYVVKILVINWEKSGTNLLGLIGNAQALGIYAFALLFAKKLMHVSDAITDVNLPVFSEKFSNNITEFKALFATNFNRVFSLIVFLAMSAVFWAPELIRIMVGSDKYNASMPLLIPMVFAFIFFSLLNIIKSSLAIPAKLVKEMMLGFAIMFAVTVGLYFVGRGFFEPAYTMSYAMLIGVVAGFSFLVFALQRTLKFSFVGFGHVAILIQALAISKLGIVPNLFIKFPLYLVVAGLFLWALSMANFVSKKEIEFIIRKGRSILFR